MRFASPLELLWLIPIAGSVVFLHVLRMRRIPATVPSLLLWNRAIRDTRADTPFKRLRSNIGFILQLVCAFLLVSTLARPVVLGSELSGRSVAIVIDNSASMNATDLLPSRLEEALGKAQALVAALGPLDRAAVVSAGPQPILLQELTGDRAQLLAAIRTAAPTDGQCDIVAAVALARTSLGSSAS